MKQRLMVMAALLFISSLARADELYSFWRVNCDNNVRALQLRQVDYWSVGYLVWPSTYPKTDPSPWLTHIKGLKQLEAKSGLYIFDEEYGYYDKPDMTLTCGAITAAFSFDKKKREDNNWVRVSTKITILAGSKLAVDNVSLASIRSFDAYLVTSNNAGDTDLYLHMCVERGCTDVSEVWWPVTSASIDKFPFTPDGLKSH